MKKNKIYESLIDKSIGSMLSAIEIYNKPDFKYREETFTILAINSWELLLKARILKLNNYRINSIYCYKPYVSKTGVKSNKKKARCPKCEKFSDKIHDYLKPSKLTYLNSAGIETYLIVQKRRFNCANCKKSFTEDLGLSQTDAKTMRDNMKKYR